MEELAGAGGVTEETRALIEERAGGNPKRIIMATFLASALHSESDSGRQSARRSGDAERRRATILFADISGFTSMTEKLGAEQSYPIVAGCLRLLDEIARKHGGTVDKYLGDCVLALFGVPEAIEDAPRAAVNAAIEMQRRVKEYNEEHGLTLPLDVHSGINTGLGISGDISGPLIREFTVMGDPVTVADQLKDRAPDGCIYLGAEAHRFTRDVFEFRPVEDLQLKGQDEHIPVFELLSRDERLYRARIGSERQVFSALVGREQELEMLREKLAGLADGQGGIVSLIAEAGIGKSRLVTELASCPGAEPVLWLEGRSLSLGQQLSLHPFADLSRQWARIEDGDDDERAREKLRALVSALAPDRAEEHLAFMATVMGMRLSEAQQALLDRIRGDALEKRIQRSVFELLRAETGRQPVVLALDDLHWADQSSIELLETLLRLAGECPVLFLDMMRPGYPTTAGRLRDFVREHHEALHLEILLHPLDGRATRSLINNLFRQGDIPYETRRLIEQKAQGNPFYIEEVVRSLVDEGAVEYREGTFVATEKIHDVAIPGTVHEVVMARVDRLEPGRKQLLQVASVVGESFHREILVGIRGEESIDQEIEALRDAEFIVPSDRMQGIEYAFKHPLIREVTYDGILHARREELHLAVGDAIESRMPEDMSGFSAMLAYHFSLGRDAERAEEYVFRAGDEAARSAASSEALQFFRQASKLYLDLHGEGGDPAKRARLHKNIARALFNRGELVEAVEAFNQAVEVLGERVPRSPLSQATRFARNLVAVLLHLYWTHRWQRPPATENQREIVELMYERSMCEVTADATRFLFDSFEVLARLSKIDLPSVQRSGLMYAAASLIFSFGGISFGLANRVLRVARPAVCEDDVPELFIYRASGFVRDFFAGAWGDESRVPEELLQENLGYGRIWDVLSYILLEADERIGQGDFSGARERIELNDKIWDQYQNDLAKSQHYYLLTRLLVEQRRLDEALQQADAYYEENPEELLHVHAFGLKGQIQVLAGDLEGAEQTLTRCAGLLLLDVTLLEQAVVGGAPREARRLARRARKSVRQALRTSSWVAARQPEVYRLTGLFHWLRGSRRRARTWWRRSLDKARSLGARPDLARTQRELGLRLREVDPAEATAALHEARAGFEALGLEWDLARTPIAER
jgi:class 3 adenylate cyclase/tetratricopeptide (TPR) repeat protein